MYKYVLKRLLMLIPVFLGVALIVYGIMAITPGDPTKLILGLEATDAEIHALRAKLGLDRPFIERYFRFILGALQGDFGESYRTGQPVFKEIFARLPVTIKLAFFSIILATIIGVPLGIISAVRQYSLMDMVSSISAMFFAAIPTFWLGLILVLLFSLKLGWFPSNGVIKASGYVLPTVAIALPGAAQIMRLTRSSMLETIRQDYIRTAQAKGINEMKVIRKHALKNALLPIVTIIGILFGVLLGGTVITETVFALPGIGSLVVTAIRMKDTPQIVAIVTLLSILYCLIMLLVDILYAYIDPRIKARYQR